MEIDHQPVADDLGEPIFTGYRLQAFVEHRQHRVGRAQVDAHMQPGRGAFPEQGERGAIRPVRSRWPP